MALLKTSKSDKRLVSSGAEGFTFVEILIAVAILAVILSLGLILSMDFYRTYSFNYEKDLIVSILQGDRSRSMANIAQSTHSVIFNSLNHEYKVLEGGSLVQTFEANDAILIAWPTEVVFNQLEGACQTCSPTIEITLTGLGKTSTIIVNNEGRIDYKKR